ncbi:MAG: hypothetical protein AAF351_03015 [Pseudomonadota bacterium]
MISGKFFSSATIAALGSICWASPAAAETSIIVDPASVTVTAEQSNRELLSLPALTYAFTIEADCGADKTPFSISISAADTVARSLTEADRLFEIELQIPARQLPPMKINDFCTVDDAEPKTVYVEGALTAQLEIECHAEPENSNFYYRYLSHPLDIELACESTEQADEARDEG